MPSKSVIGERIRNLRIQKGLTQVELAEKLGVSRQAVNNYETGDAKPSDDLKKIISEVLESDIVGLFFEE